MSTPRTFHRHRLSSLRFLALAIAVIVAAASCASTSAETAQSQGVLAVEPQPAATATAEATAPEAPEAPATEPAAEPPTAEAAPTPTPHPIAQADTELPAAAIGFDQIEQLSGPTGPQPVSIGIENINVDQATVIAVGVNQVDLSFEVPPADQVGWYEFGPRPGEPGSSVLAAHIAYNGVDGVFRNLENVEVGSVVVIGFDDGSTSRYRIEEVVEYVKEELPDSLFARDGREQLALITCGGAFNYQLDSYESNTVAIAVPI